MILYDYFRSSAAFRVRIALNLKNLPVEYREVHLLKGDQRSEAYLSVNPAGLVPALDIDDTILSQSLAIIEYLDETRPEPALLPSDPAGRARVRSLAYMVACDTHPIDNLRVLTYLRNTLAIDEEAVQTWYNHWIATSFQAIEARLDEPATGRFCHGDQPGIADICLIPQVVNARRFKLDMSSFPRIQAVFDAALALPAFADAMPRDPSPAG